MKNARGTAVNTDDILMETHGLSDLDAVGCITKYLEPRERRQLQLQKGKLCTTVC